MVSTERIHVITKKIEAVLNWKQLKNVSESHNFLGLPEFGKEFVVYSDASHVSLGCVLMQDDKVMAYASRQLKTHERNYPTHDLELAANSDVSFLLISFLFGNLCEFPLAHRAILVFVVLAEKVVVKEIRSDDLIVLLSVLAESFGGLGIAVAS
ncbi:uncharacterized protein [Gossypium hirsutum]|uniref:Reverse transcriptase/retrotransposon-derived protein RNase H-like domain-containing protein n=1 Tax=Gossypium hirsutum TaxID=3635 RepID=A0ABM2YQ99_GOSHI|nr:uncharacterized protein LOC121205042 [Gossypium hirsutum]